MANFNIDYLVVAGGGAGGSGYRSGGGGSGALKSSYSTQGGGQTQASALSLATGGSGYTVTVGNGGNYVLNANGSNGGNSAFESITSLGGGGGGGPYLATSNGSDGGTGGGGAGHNDGTTTGGSAIGSPTYGYNGGNGSGNTTQCGGGGGGAGAVGKAGGGSGTDGFGGIGIENNITGTLLYYAGGGGGGNYSVGNVTAGGNGGGGAGGSNVSGSYTNATTGTDGLGGGGGGASNGVGGGSNVQGANGGSGIVILRYTTADANYTTTGITPTEDTTTISGQTILSFIAVGTGTIIFSIPPPTLGTRVTNPVTGFESPVDIGLKLPSGTNANQPSGTQGMIRNDTGETTGSSTSAIEHYNGTTWKYFAATESVDNPLFASQNFNTVLYDGNSGVKTIDTVGFQPDLVWTKARNYACLNGLTNSINGDKTFNVANTTATIDSNDSAPKLFNSLGFTLGSGNANWNSSLYDYVSWNWKGGGLINKSADFNGSSSYIQTSLSLNAASNSISFWFNADSVGSQNAVLYFNNRGGRIDININGTGSNTPSSNFESIFINSTTAITGWNFVSIVFTGWASSYSAGGYGSPITANVYLNGGSAVSVSPTPYGWSDGLRIGRSGGGYYYDGLVGQVRVFDSALTSSQVTELYNETAADNSVLNYPQNAGCIAAYPLGENANDLSNTYNGTASNVTFGKPGYLTRNNDGTVESTVSANVDAGFSIVKYVGGVSTGIEVGHGLSLAPEIIIVKDLNSNVYNWAVYNYSVGNAKKLELNSADLNTTSGVWNNVSPTTSVFSVRYDQTNKINNNFIAYCWHSVAGYSKIGSYAGGSTGNKIYTGFEPAFLLQKCTSSANTNWHIFDNKRNVSNPRVTLLSPNTSSQEGNISGGVDFDIDGFTFITTNSSINGSGQTYIYMAFAT